MNLRSQKCLSIRVLGFTNGILFIFRIASFVACYMHKTNAKNIHASPSFIDEITPKNLQLRVISLGRASHK